MVHRLICLDVVGTVTVIEWSCTLQNFYFRHVSVIWLAVCSPAVWFRLYCYHSSVLFCSDID